MYPVLSNNLLRNQRNLIDTLFGEDFFSTPTSAASLLSFVHALLEAAVRCGSDLHPRRLQAGHSFPLRSPGDTCHQFH
jgi:hypothetical protein